jgi:hypothetical protein
MANLDTAHQLQPRTSFESSNFFKSEISFENCSLFAMASGSVALLKVLASSVFTVKDTIHGIKNVGEITRGLEEEIEAFAFVLPILEFELHKSTPLPQNHEWWDETKISALVRNATKTFKRLQAIFDEIHRQRKALQNVREFYRSTQYDIEIQHLRLRITTYINALKIPVFLLAVLVFASDRVQRPTIDHFVDMEIRIILLRPRQV